MSSRALLVYGSRDYARTVAQLALDCGQVVAGFIDDTRRADDILGDYSSLLAAGAAKQYGLAIGVGYNNLPARATLLRKCMADGWSLPALVHPRAYVHSTAALGAGVIVMAGAVIDMRTTLGDGVVCWPAVVVNHDAIVGANTFISPNATLCGFVRTGSDCMFGAGSVVTDRVEVPAGHFLKAAARLAYPRREDVP